MMNNSEQDRIIERIKKLLTLASDDPDSLECKEAMKKAAALMEKYDLDVSQFQEKQRVSLVVKDVKNYITKHLVWEGYLGYGIAKAFDCKIVRLEQPDGFVWSFIGYKSDVEIVEWFFKYTRLQIGKRAESTYTNGNKRKSYAYGLMTNVLQRIREFTEVRQSMRTEETTALVVCKGKEVEDAFNKLYPDCKVIKDRSAYSHDAIAQGIKDGDDISISMPITSEDQPSDAIDDKPIALE